ncbi:hypothetical protein BJV78DRAFT_1289127 [Lactifluus subvellereus]|nr:hypothetical protein BJV78DRAFT_1289127 [Lactifluus subvellereus]
MADQIHYQEYDETTNYHIQRLKEFFPQANLVAAHHCDAAWVPVTRQLSTPLRSRSPSYHVTTPPPRPSSPEPALQARFRAPTPPMLLEPGDDNEINCVAPSTHTRDHPIRRIDRTARIASRQSRRTPTSRWQGAPSLPSPPQSETGPGYHSPLTPYRQKVLEHSEVFSHLVTLAAANTNDPFIQAEVQRYRALGLERLNDFDDCVDRLVEGNVYRQLYPGLENQTLRQPTDADEDEEARYQLFVHLQVAGDPFTPRPVPNMEMRSLRSLAERFDDIPMEHEDEENMDYSVYDG